MNGDLRGNLKKAGFLRRDSRKVERKKYGQPGARKRFQFSKPQSARPSKSDIQKGPLVRSFFACFRFDS